MSVRAGGAAAAGDRHHSALSVLHVGPTPFHSDRGCHIRIAGLVRALARRAVAGRLCTYHHGREVEGVDTVRIPRVPGYTHVDAGPAPLKYVADVLLFLRVCVQLVRWRPDVIHGHLHEGALIGWAASRLVFWRRVPVVFDMQGSLVGELEEYGYFDRLGPLRRLFVWLERFVDHRPDAIAASSSSSLEIARDRFGVPAERLHLVADGVDVSVPAPERVVALRESLGLPAGVPVAVYSGSLLPVKGLATLHQIVQQAVARRVEVHFVLVGYPTDATAAFLAAQGLQHRCTLVGRVPFEAIAEYLGLADLALEPKESASGEASGKLLNYLAAGLPVVAFDTDNNRQLLGEAGCYASAGSAADFVERLDELSRDPAHRREVGALGRRRVERDFSWDLSAERLTDIYQTLLGSGSSATGHRGGAPGT